MRHTCAARRLLVAAILINVVCPAVDADTPSSTVRTLYAVNESSNNRGSISVYDLDAGHRLIRTIHTVPNVDDVRGVAGSAITGKLYVAYYSASGAGMVYCLDTVLWNREITVLRCLAWVATISVWKHEIEFGCEQVNHGFEVAD
jgi:hypothetical protein